MYDGSLYFNQYITFFNTFDLSVKFMEGQALTAVVPVRYWSVIGNYYEQVYKQYKK